MGGCFSTEDLDLLKNLATTPFFALNEIDRELLHEVFELVQYQQPTELWYSGSKQTTFNIIKSGEVMLTFTINNQQVTVLKSEGQCFGYHALKQSAGTQKARGVYYAAKTISKTATFWRLQPEKLQKFWKKNPIIHHKFISSKVIPLDRFIREIDVFKDVSYEASGILSSMFEWQWLPKDQLLFEEGSIGEEFYIIAKGTIVVLANIREAQEDEANRHYELEMIRSERAQSEASHYTDQTGYTAAVPIGIGGVGVKMISPDMLRTETERETVQKSLAYQHKLSHTGFAPLDKKSAAAAKKHSKASSQNKSHKKTSSQLSAGKNIERLESQSEIKREKEALKSGDKSMTINVS